MAGIIQDTAYGLSQAILAVNPHPIISLRNPTVRDKAQLGQMWINRTTGIAFFLTRIASNSYTWAQGASAVAALNVAGAATIGTTLDVTGLSTLIGGATLNAALTITVGGAAITGNSTVTGTFGVTGVTTLTGATHVVGAMDATTTITAGTGLVATTGGVTATAGGLTVTAGGAAISGTTTINTTTATTTSIGRGGTGLLNLGNLTADTTIWGNDVIVELGDAAGANSFQILDNTTAAMATIDSNGNFSTALNIVSVGGGITATAGNITSTLGNIVATQGDIIATLGDITATAGDITAANGNIIISTATKGVSLPGPTTIVTGAGAPANGLAVNIGDIYIRTDAGGAAERIYIADGIGSWVNITCSA